MSNPYDKLAFADEFERLRRFRQDVDDAILAEEQAAAPNSNIRRADPTPDYPGNRHQRRAAARKARS